MKMCFLEDLCKLDGKDLAEAREVLLKKYGGSKDRIRKWMQHLEKKGLIYVTGDLRLRVCKRKLRKYLL